MMIKFLFLYFANLVLDYPLQGTFLAEYKQKNNYALFVHSAIWGLGLSIVLMFIGLFAWWKVLMLVAGHYIIDYWKCRGIYKKWPKKTITGNVMGSARIPIIGDLGAYYIDQFLHVVQILLCFI